MSLKLPAELEREVADMGVASLSRGRSVRRLDVLLPGLVLGALLAVLSASAISDGFVVAVTVVAASLCAIWAMMSVSASLNAQIDVLTTVVVYYAESDRRRSPRHTAENSD